MQLRLSLAVAVLVGVGLLTLVTDVQSRTHDGGSSLVPRIVARALPAVVSITTRQIEYNQFNQPASTRGLGSGFLLDRSGHVLTNHHVVEGAEEIKVALTDGRVFRAALVGADRFTDLAVLKIEGRSLPALRLAARPARRGNGRGDRASGSRAGRP
jgi:S1-C subfamily serine protease